MLQELDALVEPNDWVEILDPKKNDYYYFNYSTNENTWTLPEEFSQWKNSEIDKFLKRSRATWRRYEDKKKKSYYYDKSTNTTQWNPPEEVAEYVMLLDKLTKRRHKKRKHDASQDPHLTSPMKSQKPELVDKSRDVEESKEMKGEVAAKDDEFHDFDTYDNFHEYSAEGSAQDAEMKADFEVTPATAQAEDGYDDWETSPVHQLGALAEEPMAPVAKADDRVEDQSRLLLASIEAQLSRPDAVMEPGVHDLLAELASAESEGAEDSVRKGVTALIQGYRGFAQMVGLVSQWLMKALSASRTRDSFGIPSDMEANAMNFVARYIEGERSTHRNLLLNCNRKFFFLTSGRAVVERNPSLAA